MGGGDDSETVLCCITVVETGHCSMLKPIELYCKLQILANHHQLGQVYHINVIFKRLSSGREDGWVGRTWELYFLLAFSGILFFIYLWK